MGVSMAESTSSQAATHQLWPDIRRILAVAYGPLKCRPNWIAGLLFVVCALSGCEPQIVIDQVPPEDRNFAKQYIALFQKSDFAAIEETLNPQMKNAQLRPTLMLMATLIPAEAPTSVEIVQAEITISTGDSRTTALKIEYQFSKAWLIVDISISRANGSTVVDYIYFTPMATSWKEVNAFTLGGKPVLSYVFLLVSVFVVTFMIVSLIVCLVTPIPKRKWLWCILAFVGVGSLGLNWTSGEVDFQIFSVGIFNIWFGRVGVDGPYYLQTYVPVGAIVFWIRRRAWLRDQAASPLP